MQQALSTSASCPAEYQSLVHSHTPPPVGAELERPPLAPIAHILDRMLRRTENQGAGPEHIRPRRRRHGRSPGQTRGIRGLSPECDRSRSRRRSRYGRGPLPYNACPTPSGTRHRRSTPCPDTKAPPGSNHRQAVQSALENSPVPPLPIGSHRARAGYRLAEALSRPSTSILGLTILTGQMGLVKPAATATFCAPFTV